LLLRVAPVYCYRHASSLETEVLVRDLNRRLLTGAALAALALLSLPLLMAGALIATAMSFAF
jgi:hypothetical protein